MKKLLLGGALLLAFGGSAALAATEESNLTATLTIVEECEVIVAAASATAGNFGSGNATLAVSGSYPSGAGYFDEVPGTTQGAPLPAEGAAAATHNVAVLCSQKGTASSVAFTADEFLAGGGGNIVWTPSVADVGGGSANLVQFAGGVGVPYAATADIPLHATDARSATFAVTGVVTAANIADAPPGTYTATVNVIVTY